MSLAHLFDSAAVVYRGTVTRGPHMEEVRTLVPVAAYPCAVNRPAAPLGNPGPGLTATGGRRFYFDVGADIRLRDVLALQGPDTDVWEVNEPPTRPRGHHLEVQAIAWSGVLPAGES